MAALGILRAGLKRLAALWATDLPARVLTGSIELILAMRTDHKHQATLSIRPDTPSICPYPAGRRITDYPRQKRIQVQPVLRQNVPVPVFAGNHRTMSADRFAYIRRHRSVVANCSPRNPAAIFKSETGSDVTGHGEAFAPSVPSLPHTGYPYRNDRTRPLRRPSARCCQARGPAGCASAR